MRLACDPLFDEVDITASAEELSRLAGAVLPPAVDAGEIFYLEHLSPSQPWARTPRCQDSTTRSTLPSIALSR